MNEFILILPEIFLVLTLAFVLIGEITYHGEEVRLITIQMKQTHSRTGPQGPG